MADYGFRVIFKEAINFLRSKNVVPIEEYANIDDKFKSRAFTVSGYSSLEILQEFLKKLNEACEKGKTKEEFRNEMNEFLTENGYSSEKRWHLDNIFQTNMQTAFQVGHYESMTEEKTMNLRPYWQYVTAEDGHVRDTHMAMNRKVYRADDPIWDIWYPPNGYGCRCMVISLSENQLKRRGLKVDKEVPYDIDRGTGEIIPIFPDKGFSTNQAKKEWKPDMRCFDKNIREIYYSHNKK